MNWPLLWPVLPDRGRRILLDHKARSQAVTPVTPANTKALVDVALDCWCGRPARLLVLVHQLDCCTGQLGFDVDLTPDGDTMHIVCVPCANNIHANLRREVGKRLSRPPHGVIHRCNTCGTPITCVNDVMERDLL